MCVHCWGFWGVGQSFKKGTLASPAPLGSGVLPGGWGSLLFFPPALPQGIKSCPPPHPAFPRGGFPKAQGRVQHPDLNFNAILAPKASFCCLERKLIRKVLSAPALQDLGLCSALGRSSPCPAALPPALQRGGSLCFDICYYYFSFSFQLKGFESKSDASLSVPDRVCRVPGVAALGGSETFWESRASSPIHAA